MPHKAYQQNQISERHRHRYEFNNKYKEKMEQKGFKISGILKNENLCEIAEFKNHPWMVGVQFHPEFKSKPTKPHPLFRDFIKAMIHHHEEAIVQRQIILKIKPKRLVGIDFGMTRLGVAISDERQIIATPFQTIQAEKKAELTIAKILALISQIQAVSSL